MVAIDVGATNVRARIVTVADGGEVTSPAADITAQVGSARSLYEFVADVVRAAERHGEVTETVVAVAGMMDVDCCNITNWPTDSLIELSRLEAAGLPARRTWLVNDVVAGVWGARARIDGGAAREPALSAPALGEGSLVYLAPGTGLGAATLVRHGLGPLGASVVACEAQHTQIPRFAGDIARTVDALVGTLRREPTWEELVSGPGLERIYRAQCAIAGTEAVAAPRDEASRASTGPGAPATPGAGAGAIAAAALAGDAAALAAVRVYYQALGHFAQLLVLTHLPCAAVVIGGASTKHNLDLLRASGLTETFAEHPRFGGLLREIPVHTADGDLNLEGGLWLAARLGAPEA